MIRGCGHGVWKMCGMQAQNWRCLCHCVFFLFAQQQSAPEPQHLRDTNTNTRTHIWFILLLGTLHWHHTFSSTLPETNYHIILTLTLKPSFNLQKGLCTSWDKIIVQIFTGSPHKLVRCQIFVLMYLKQAHTYCEYTHFFFLAIFSRTLYWLSF